MIINAWEFHAIKWTTLRSKAIDTNNEYNDGRNELAYFCFIFGSFSWVRVLSKRNIGDLNDSELLLLLLYFPTNQIHPNFSRFLSKTIQVNRLQFWLLFIIVLGFSQSCVTISIYRKRHYGIFLSVLKQLYLSIGGEME